MRRAYREFKKLHDIPTGFNWLGPHYKTVSTLDDVWDDYTKVLSFGLDYNCRRVQKETNSFDQARAASQSTTRIRYLTKTTIMRMMTSTPFKITLHHYFVIPNVSREVYLKAFHVIGSNCRVLFIFAPENIRSFMLDLFDFDRYQQY